MKPIERVSLALQHKEADRVPVYPLMNGISRKLINASYDVWTKDVDKCAEAYIKVTEKLDLDIICTLIDLSLEAADFGQNVLYPKDDAAYSDVNNRLIKEIEDYKKIEPVNPRKTLRMSKHIKLCDTLVKAKGRDVPIVAFVFGPLGITSMLRGQENMFMDIIDDPDSVKCTVEAITQTLIEYCGALIETGVNAIMIDTLYASQSIMSKSMWLDLEGPYVERIAKYVHSKGCMFMIHNCGNGPYFDVQIDKMKPEAISFLHTPDDCASYADVKEKYGSKTTLIGHVSPPWLISASPEEVEEECKKEIDTFKKGGGYILATGCEYPSNSTFKNAEIMVKTAKEYGRYLLNYKPGNRHLSCELFIPFLL
jgi:uroporphyrinogen decarboxylase